jgi:diguanylate cyclase (GGDEF)-like protein
MMSQGEIIGMLFIKFQDWNLNLTPEEEDHILSLKQSLAVTIVEHLTLALINLHLQESLRIQSIQDRLTGLYNRRFLDESLKREAANIKRHKYSVGIIMIDVDFFKKFNDTYGHDCGDAVLRELGKLLKTNTRGEDIACRYGGEEFAIILVRTTLEGAIAKAEKICKKVRDDMVVKHGGMGHKVTISMGVALCPDHSDEVENVILAADAALYEAKENGRDQVAVAKKE